MSVVTRSNSAINESSPLITSKSSRITKLCQSKLAQMLFVVAVGSLLIGLGQAHVITQLTSPAALAGISGGMGAFILGNVILCKKRVIFEAGHSFKRVLWHLEKNDPKKGFSSEIVPGLTISGLPSEADNLSQYHLVVNCCEEWEYLEATDASGRHFLTPEDHKKAGRRVLLVPTGDYGAVKTGALLAAADKIREYINQGKKVLVHCKSGEGRSAQVIAAYLIRYNTQSTQTAIQTIQDNRTRALGRSNQRDHLTAIEPELQKRVVHLQQGESYVPARQQ